eukprot:114829_1
MELVHLVHELSAPRANNIDVEMGLVGCLTSGIQLCRGMDKVMTLWDLIVFIGDLIVFTGDPIVVLYSFQYPISLLKEEEMLDFQGVCMISTSCEYWSLE